MDVTCEPRLHEFRTTRLVLRSPGHRDHRIMLATASDPAAQRWLGWPRTRVTRASAIERVMAGRDGGLRVRLRPPAGDFAIVWDGRVVGGAGLQAVDEPDVIEVGNYLAPEVRGQGLGTEAIRGLTDFSHHHLGIRRVRAGMEFGNIASERQFLACGFVRCDGPAVHRLSNGRRVPAEWWCHDDDTASAACSRS